MIKNVISVALLSAFAAFAGSCDDPGKVRGTAGNFSADMQGLIDTRPDTWGTSSAVLKPLTFKAPAGCSVEVVKVIGDFVAWPLGEVPGGMQAGVLISIERTGVPDAWTSDPSKLADYASPGVFLYLQVGTNGPPARVAFDTKVVDGFLSEDNVLEFKMAEWLNNTARKIHMEVSFVVHFRFVELQASPIQLLPSHNPDRTSRALGPAPRPRSPA